MITQTFKMQFQCVMWIQGTHRQYQHSLQSSIPITKTCKKWVMTLSSSMAMYSVMRDIPDARKVPMERGWVALYLYATCKFSNLLTLEQWAFEYGLPLFWYALYIIVFIKWKLFNITLGNGWDFPFYLFSQISLLLINYVQVLSFFLSQNLILARPVTSYSDVILINDMIGWNNVQIFNRLIHVKTKSTEGKVSLIGMCDQRYGQFYQEIQAVMICHIIIIH